MKKLFFTFALSFLGLFSYAQSEDEKAIKKVITDEATAIHARDLNKWLNCFAQSEDVIFGYHAALPTYMLRGYKDLEAWATKYLKGEVNKDSFVINDYRIRIKGVTAFVSSIQETTKPDGSKTKAHKVDYLEKINGEWKIIGHLFGNEPVK